MDYLEIPQSSTAKEFESNKETWCLIRVGKASDWLCLPENTEVTIGRGLNVTHQLVSASCPLMISRLHCLFKQGEDGQWTVTDKKSLNGVWVNGKRIPAEKPHPLCQGDSIQLGVPFITGTKVEYEYTLVQQPFEEIKPHLSREPNDWAASRSKKAKRKLNADELEPSTSSKSKLYRRSASDKSLAQGCPTDERPETPGPRTGDESGPSVGTEKQHPLPERPGSPGSDLTSRLMYSQNMLALRERMDTTQRRVAALEGAQQQEHPHRGEQVKELQTQLEVLRGQVHKMEVLEKSISETEKRLEVQKTQQQEELLKRQLKEALQEQRKVIAELALSRQGFEEVLLAKDKELELTKEEKERARAQKEEVVTQMTEVLENELQCIICSELFIKAITLNCAHSFCLHCITEWRRRKDECPICRQAILSQTPSLVLDNCIDRMVDNLSPDMRERRQTLIAERRGERSQT